jgi:hypothetical protein
MMAMARLKSCKRARELAFVSDNLAEGAGCRAKLAVPKAAAVLQRISTWCCLRKVLSQAVRACSIFFS